MTALPSTQSFACAARELAPSHAPIDAFKSAMRWLANGVSLVTHGAGDARVGMTATSVSSLSADPPTLIVCINRSASLYAALKPGAAFGVSVLAAGQSEYADRFAGRTGLAGAARFDEGSWRRLPSGVSALADAAAIFECEVEDLVERHSHVIVIGRVRAAFSGTQASALLYWRGAYEQLGWSEDEISRAIGLSPTR